MDPVMAKFNPLFYRELRPFYPPEVFAGIKEGLLKRRFQEPFQIADLGCGTGHSAVSLFKASIQADVIGIDPDPAMLSEAQGLADRLGWRNLKLQLGSGEETHLPDCAVDAVLMVSSFHWMHVEKTRDEVLRNLKPSGLIWIFEYQFPKAPELPELNEWIRRQFNLHWKAPGQVPRGNFTEVTQIFRNDSRLQIIAYRPIPLEQPLTVDELAGIIFFQSRVLHYEDSVADLAKTQFREQIRRELSERMSQGSTVFQFRLQLLGCAKKSV